MLRYVSLNFARRATWGGLVQRSIHTFPRTVINGPTRLWWMATRQYSSAKALTKEEVESRIISLLKGFEKAAKSDKISPSAQFSKDLGLDSLDTVEVVMAIEEEFSIEIPDKEADSISSVDQAVNYILSQPDDACVRLRRAIVRNDPSLVLRLIRSHPQILQNPDFRDKSNTSLHLASQFGFLDVVKILLDAGHEAQGISRNDDGNTPLILALENNNTNVANHLISVCPESITCLNKLNQDALMVCARSSSSLIQRLLSVGPTSAVSTRDIYGNTALHYAAISGDADAVRLLIQHGASPLQQNSSSWTPLQYASSPSLEQIMKSALVSTNKPSPS